MASNPDRGSPAQPYGGYHEPRTGNPDEELTAIGPGTACGEYLRRYWQPIAMVSKLGELPRLVRILGEDLVLFRTLAGEPGLVHRHCPHRRASLEYGSCEQHGLRCCYHGWLFAPDGTVLEVPGQPPGVEEKIQGRVTLGAYPTHEYKGLIFAYLGPPALRPAFPVYDTLEFPDQEMVPYRAPFKCNWLQVLDAIVDPIHTSFLHSRASRAQYSQGLGEVGELNFYERGQHFIGTNTRRVGEHVWVRVNELVLPNYTQAGAAFATDGTRSRYYGRTAFSRWVVPIDDQNTVAYAWANFGERGDPPEYNTPEGPELIEQGEPFQRSYEQRQRFPADVEAVEGMGAITSHDLENLVPSDKGIARYRRRLHKIIGAMQRGDEPGRSTDERPDPVPTYGGDTVLRVPDTGGDDTARLRGIETAVMQAQFDADELTGRARDEFVIERLRAIESAQD